MQPVPLQARQKPLIGIAIFHGLGDILNATIIARQIRSDHPDAHVVWYTAAQYAFILDGNPDVDEIVPLEGDPKALDSRIEKLRRERDWDAFYIPAPYLAYDKLPGGDLTELMLATYDRPITVPLRPVLVLSQQEVERARQWWAQLPSDRPRILVETEFFSQQSPWDPSYALPSSRHSSNIGRCLSLRQKIAHHTWMCFETYIPTAFGVTFRSDSTLNSTTCAMHSSACHRQSRA